jgi:hypothetical protein
VACVPSTCDAFAGQCGSFPDGCVGLVTCGCGDTPQEQAEILCDTQAKACECTWAPTYSGMCASDPTHPYARLCGSQTAQDHQLDCYFKQTSSTNPLHHVWCCAS